VRQPRIGRCHGLGHGIDRLAVHLIGQVARIRRAFEAPPFVFQRLVGGDGLLLFELNSFVIFGIKSFG
jgi:hypothetical protein